MTDLEQLKELRKLLAEKRKFENRSIMLQEEVDNNSPLLKLDYMKDSHYKNKVWKLEKIFLLLSILISIFALYGLLPIYGERFPNQVKYVEFEYLAYILVFGFIFLTSIFVIKNFKESTVNNLFNALKKQYEHISFQFFIGFMVVVAYIVIYIISVFHEFNDLFLIKLEEVMNIAILVVVISLAYITIINIVFLVLYPFKKMLVDLCPSFRKIRKRISGDKSNSKTINKSDINHNENLIKKFNEQIEKNNIVVDEFKDLEIIDGMIETYSENPETSLRYALNIGINMKKQSEYNDTLEKLHISISDKLERYNEEISRINAKYKATVKVYNQDLKDSYMKLSYKKNQNVELLINRLDKIEERQLSYSDIQTANRIRKNLEDRL